MNKIDKFEEDRHGLHGEKKCDMVAIFLDNNNMELNQQQRRQRQERQKSNRFILAKQKLCTCITLFCVFLSRR